MKRNSYAIPTQSVPVPPMANSMKNDTNWELSSKICLVRLLDRLAELAQECAEPKQLVESIKAVGDIVGATVVDGGEGDG